ncbi:hypothetical protein [Deinococcus sp. UR1]|uniref:hypothetical protein n=1 Tax=Deinococcus sp. UR1 TaxID=1704277 RepID=UPI0006DBE604|nr:hypothetical protein [Deinococcus sp. UR1]PIH00297.1 hypothetical protein AMD26_001635 [Deinococcus sp. UR1]
MNWEQLQEELIRRIREQPRGFQTNLAKRLNIAPASIARYTTQGYGIPSAHITPILEELGLELTLQHKEN